MQKQVEITRSIWDTSIPLEKRLDYLIGELTLEEKIQALTTRQPAILRLGLLEFQIGGEAAHGIEARHDQVFNHGKSIATTVFTEPIGMSATWDTDLIHKAGEVVGTEARAVYRVDGTGLSRWAPTVDMERDPRWGRNEEGYGEDPYLTGEMASAYIQGMQGDDPYYLRCGATLKHFYANNEETDRVFSSSSIDRRNKWEYYLEPFRRTIMEGRCESVMTSYNEINGVPAIANHEVRQILKEQFGLKGHVVCDMRDLAQTKSEHHFVETDEEALALALRAGIDVFNDPEEFVIETAWKAYKTGLITEEDIDRAVRRTFATRLRLGLGVNEDCPYNEIGADWLTCKKHERISREVARKGIVLLKNEGNFLPFYSSNTETIAVIGPLAGEWFQDWYAGNPKNRVTPWQGLKKQFSEDSLRLVGGADLVNVQIGEEYMAVREDGSCYLGSKEGAEIFEWMDWGPYGVTIRAVSNNKYVSIEQETREISAKKDEVFSWTVEEVFFVEPEQKGLVSLRLYDGSYVGRNDGNGIICRSEKTPIRIEVLVDGVEEAVDAARGADKVIAVMGCHPIICGKEERDRKDLELPRRQQELLEGVYKENLKLALVLIANYPYAIGWAKNNVPAILLSASGSQDLGTAIAEIIGGVYSPAGRLTMTWYKSDTDLPEMRDYDIIQGKRTYQYFDREVLYPFGHGLSYTSFEYRSLSVEKRENTYYITVSVANIGTVDSDEVVQLYVHQCASRTIRPIRQLKGFQRTFILVGEEKTIIFELPVEELAYYDVVTAKKVVEHGEYELQIGGSSGCISKKMTIEVEGVKIPPRDMKQRIYCDQYDGYTNLSLVYGKEEVPAMIPRRGEKPGVAIYRDVLFSHCPERIVVELFTEERSCLIIRMEGKEVVREEVEKTDGVQEMEVPLSKEKIPLQERLQLEIELVGRIKILSFVFE